ncbi:MAG: LPS export ABC transporter periplasmic protein LptC [Candidatus Riflebacteria bacterium]|nr:LPS export ABC transporter periplasmic protein LptC [Candidatus Riflebacteria bacterium]
MIKNIFSSFWFWGILLIAFVTIILWDDSIEEGAKGTYVKHKMTLNNVNFSQIDNGFEHARMYATICEMDDSQTNMEARDIKVLFFKEDVATFTGRLIAASATKTPFEAKFYGDVRLWDTDNERMRTEEMRYLFNRKELSTQKPITVWKDNAVLTGLGMTYNTERKEITVNQQVVIRLWEEKKEEPKPMNDIDPVSGLPVAEPIDKILNNINKSDANNNGIVKASETQTISNNTTSSASQTNLVTQETNK